MIALENKLRNPIEVERRQREKLLSSIEVISREDVERLWGIKLENPNSTSIHFKKHAIDEVIMDLDGFDYFIIYLTGLPIKRLKTMALGKVDVLKTALNVDDFIRQERAGYFLIKIRRRDLSGMPPENQDFNEILPKGWRRASLREASEIILNILFVLNNKIYTREWHTCQDDDGPARKKNNWDQEVKMVKLGFKKSKNHELVFKTIEPFEIPISTNSITIKTF